MKRHDEAYRLLQELYGEPDVIALCNGWGRPHSTPVDPSWEKARIGPDPNKIYRSDSN